MANRTFLYRSDHPAIKPARAVEIGGMLNFDEEQHTLLAAPYCLPLMWLTLFSSDSLVSERFTVDDQDNWKRIEEDEIVLEGDEIVLLESPIGDVELCLDRIDENTRKLEHVLRLRQSDLADHAINLKAAIEQGSGKYVTADYEELHAMLGMTIPSVRAVLAYFDGGPEAEVYAHCVSLAGLGEMDFLPGLFPQATGFFEGEFTEEDQQNLSILLGYGWLKDAPWEK